MAISKAFRNKNRLQEIISVRSDHLAEGDGSADDTAAAQAAHDALGANGGAIWFPPSKAGGTTGGTYKISSVTISKQCDIRGAAAHTGGTYIRAADATSNVFNVTTAGTVTFRDLYFDSTVTRTAGAFIYFNTTSSIGKVENVTMSGWYYGIHLAGVSDFTFENVTLKNGVVTNGIGINVDSGLAVRMMNVLCDNPNGSEPAAGLHISNSGDITLIDCKFIHCVNGMVIRPGSGQTVASIYATNCDFDNNSTRGVWIAPAHTTGTAHRIRFDGCWFASSDTGAGCTIDTQSVAGTVDGVTFIDPEVFLNGDHGISLQGANTKRIKILGGKIAQNTGNGVLIGNGADNIQIIGATIGAIGSLTGNTAYGISNSAGVTDDLLVIGCQLTGNTTAAVQPGATGSRRKFVNNNGWVTENSGTGSIPNASTSADITHGLDVTPTAADICVTFTESPSNDPGNIWVSDITASAFRVNCRADPGASNLDFSWQARVL